MSGLVSELQRACLDSTIRTTEVLQKAYVVARKLGIKEFEIWLDKEIRGYKDKDEPPDYRFLTGQVKVWNPMRGWIPVVTEHPDFHRAISTMPTFQPIGELEDIVSRSTHKDNGVLAMSFTPEQENMILGPSSPMATPRLHVPASGVQGIIDKVRHAVLTWSLDLEEKGIKGEGMTFSEHEKKVAESIQNIEVHYHGDVSQSQVATTHSSQITNLHASLDELGSFVEEILRNIPKLGLSAGKQTQVKAEVGTIESQLSAPKPSLGIIAEALKSIRAILEGVTGNLIAAAILGKMPRFL